MCHHDQNTSTTHQTPIHSIFGNIYEYGKRYLNNMHFGLTYDEYQQKSTNVKNPSNRKQTKPQLGYSSAPVVKVWSGR
jgi:hypothetical protein